MLQSKNQSRKNGQIQSEDEFICQYNRTYRKISYEQRMKAIKLIKDQRLSYRKVGKILQISPSTVKMIVSRYEKTGTVFQSKRQRKQRKEKAYYKQNCQNKEKNQYEKFGQEMQKQPNKYITFYGIYQPSQCYFYIM